MSEYHKIHSVYKREADGNRRMLWGQFSLPEFEYLQHCEWVYTEKVDGTNIRVTVNEGEVRLGGRTDNAAIPAKLLQRLQDRFLAPVEKARLIQKLPSAVLYGEGYGAGIQRGGNYRPDQDFVLFDVLVEGWWLKRADVEDVAKVLGLEVVPLVGKGTLADMTQYVECRPQSVWGAFEAEGVVARPSVELKTRAGDRIITKLKAKDFDYPLVSG